MSVVIDVRVLDAGVSLDPLQDLIECLWHDSGEVDNVLVPVAIEARGEHEPGAVVENHPPEIVHGADAHELFSVCGILSHLLNRLAELLSHTWLDVKEKGELARIPDSLTVVSVRGRRGSRRGIGRCGHD